VSDAPHPARVTTDAWIAQGNASRAATAHALAVADAGPMVDPCDPTPRPPICGVTSAPVPRDPPGMSHRVPPLGAEVVTVAHVLASLEVCRLAVEHMGRRVVSRERGPARTATRAPPPVVPDLVPGIEAPDLGPVDDYLPGRGDAVAWDDA
jgi:hypothetical protein